MNTLIAVVIFLAEAGIPIAGAIYFWRRKDGTFLTFLAGVAGFVVSQQVLRIPLLNLLREKTMWYSMMPYRSSVGYFLFMGLTAGIFEETARWICFKFLRKNRVSWIEGLAYGLGHGGIEAIGIFLMTANSVIKQGLTSP